MFVGNNGHCGKYIMAHDDDVWQRRYHDEFGHDHIFDDCPEYGWESRYKTRKRMNRVWCNGDKTVIRGHMVTTDGEELVVLNPDRTVTRYSHYEERQIHHDVRAVDICAGTTFTLGGSGNAVFMRDADDNLIYVLRDGTARMLDGLPKAQQMIRATGMTLLINDDCVYIARDERTDEIAVMKCSDIGIKAKQISICDGIGVYIDLEDKVWYSTDVDDPQRIEWRPFFDMEGKWVSCGGETLVLIDIHDDIWRFGRDDDIPEKIEGIKGMKVYLDDSAQVIIDVHHNVWMIGDNEHNCLGLGDHVTSTLHPIKWEGYKALDAHIGKYNRYLMGARLDGVDKYPLG